MERDCATAGSNAPETASRGFSPREHAVLERAVMSVHCVQSNAAPFDSCGRAVGLRRACSPS